MKKINWNSTWLIFVVIAVFALLILNANLPKSGISNTNEPMTSQQQSKPLVKIPDNIPVGSLALGLIWVVVCIITWYLLNKYTIDKVREPTATITPKEGWEIYLVYKLTLHKLPVVAGAFRATLQEEAAFAEAISQVNERLVALTKDIPISELKSRIHEIFQEVQVERLRQLDPNRFGWAISGVSFWRLNYSEEAETALQAKGQGDADREYATGVLGREPAGFMDLLSAAALAFSRRVTKTSTPEEPTNEDAK